MMRICAVLFILALPSEVQACPRCDDAQGALQLRAALLYAEFLDVAVPPPVLRRRSVPLALSLSAVVPGLGQAYNRQWIKAGVAAAVEIAIIVTYTSWYSSGNNGRDAYQAFAHRDWSPIRYAYWLNDYTDYLNTLPGGRAVSAGPIDITTNLQSIDFGNPDAWTAQEQLLVRGMILSIRAVEDRIYHPETGASFSHKLPLFGEQQYYELIGKYFQFAPGWQDYAFVIRDGVPRWVDAEGNFLMSIDPEMTAGDGSKPNVSPLFRRYADDHASANGYLRRASRVSLLFLVNHLLAAVDAAIFAKLHNNRLKTSVYLYQDGTGEVQPVASLRVSL